MFGQLREQRACEEGNASYRPFGVESGVRGLNVSYVWTCVALAMPFMTKQRINQLHMQGSGSEHSCLYNYSEGRGMQREGASECEREREHSMVVPCRLQDSDSHKASSF